MKQDQDIRWKQRFENFEKVFLFLEKAVKIKKYNELTHTYDEKQAQKAVTTICDQYFSGIEQVYLKLRAKL